jgi:gluconolactonase
MQGEVIAEGLEFPEGPVWVDGVLYVTEAMNGTIVRWTPDDRGGGSWERAFTTTVGPNGGAVGNDGALLVTQNGGMTQERRVQPGIQRVDHNGNVTMLATSVDGRDLDAPNDLAFDPDGRLWFTDPRGLPDPTRNSQPGRVFVLDVRTGEGELVVEVGPAYPNGIAFLADATLVWTESFSRRVMALVDGKPEVVLELPDRHFPDGCCVGADGQLYVAATFGHCVDVIADGVIVDRLECGDGMATNCCFGGTDLYVTESRHGTVWRYALGVDGLPLHTGPTQRRAAGT